MNQLLRRSIKILCFFRRSLYEHGGDALSRQFAEVVKKHSRPVPATDILNSIAVDEELGVGGEFLEFCYFIFIKKNFQP